VSNQIESDAGRGYADNEGEQTPSSQDDHLNGVEDGCGCTEVWEHLSEQRDGDADD